MGPFPQVASSAAYDLATTMILAISAAVALLFATGRASGGVLLSVAIAQAVVLAVLGELTASICGAVLVGVAVAAIVRERPSWSTGGFSLATFSGKSVDGRAFELEWLGLKVLVAIGRTPKP